MPDDDEIRQQAEAILRDIGLGDWEELVDPIAEELREVYADGMSAGLEALDLTISVDHVHARAVEWARDRAASLVTDLEDNTRDMLRSTVVDALEERWGARELADAIAESIGFSDDRAEMVARTEIIGSHAQGSLAGYKDAAQSGVRVLKEWIDNDSEDSCA